ncbi:MAG: G-D-S-L family lipolytic protein [Pedobacter sp.]|nr:MAG: G-D-S-L family lipolytic protein [Pedobacter sp.]
MFKKLISTGLLLALCFVLMSHNTIKPKRIIFFGDSITQAGVQGEGYINLLKKELDPTQFELIGAGIGGNKVYDLYLRLEDDVLSKKPDVVVIYVGINDVWHKLGAKTGTDYDKFLKFYEAIIAKIKANGAQVILCTPSVIGEKYDGTNEVDADLDKYAQGIRDLAQKSKAPLCDLRKAFLDYENAQNTSNLDQGILTTDKVHLNLTGNKLVAQTLKPFF